MPAGFVAVHLPVFLVMEISCGVVAGAVCADIHPQLANRTAAIAHFLRGNDCFIVLFFKGFFDFAKIVFVFYSGKRKQSFNFLFLKIVFLGNW